MRTQKSLFRGQVRPFETLRGLVLGIVRDRGGVAAIEFGIMIPLFSLMTVSVTDIGLAVYRKMQVENAAQAGAQYAIARGFDTSGISNAVTSARAHSPPAALPAVARSR